MALCGWPYQYITLTGNQPNNRRGGGAILGELDNARMTFSKHHLENGYAYGEKFQRLGIVAILNAHDWQVWTQGHNRDSV